MTPVSETVEHWLGLCRKPPAMHALEAGICIVPESVHEGLPDGGAGGSGTIRRGIGAALSGMRTLNRNRQLLWFTLLAFLVLAGNSIAQAALSYAGWNLHIQPDIIVSYMLDFFIEFATMLCLVFLLAGLVLSLSSKKDRSVSFFEGLAGAKKYINPIALWSFILALAGMLLYRTWVYFFAWLPPELRYLNTFGPGFFTSISLEFPFNLTLYPGKVIGEIPGYGDQSALLWIYPSGFTQALDFLAINLFLIILTPFVVPVIVLGHKTLREAVGESFALLKKTWIEITVCAVFLGVVAYGVFLTYLLVQAAHGMVTPHEFADTHPTVIWFALGLLYDLALISIAFVVATVGGIAALDLYRSAKTRESAE
jgi:hypothetical protein